MGLEIESRWTLGWGASKGLGLRWRAALAAKSSHLGSPRYWCAYGTRGHHHQGNASRGARRCPAGRHPGDERALAPAVDLRMLQQAPDRRRPPCWRRSGRSEPASMPCSRADIGAASGRLVMTETAAKPFCFRRFTRRQAIAPLIPRSF